VTDCHFLFQSEARISIVIPAYNEEERIIPLLQTIGTLDIPAEDIELIIVDDGSLDRTSGICQMEVDRRFPLGKVITLPSNKGKGSALQVGVAAASSPLIITMDADMATDLSAIEPAIRGLTVSHIVIGSRVTEGSKTQGVSSTRRLVTIGFSLFLRMVTKYKVSDTQCGFKAYQSPAAKVLFSFSKVKGFAQDAEILDLAYRNNFSISEIPVQWRAVPGSKVNLVRDSLSSFLEFIWYRLSVGRAKPIDGVSIRNGGEGEVPEDEVLGFFPPESIFVVYKSRTDVLMPGMHRTQIEKLVDAFNLKYPYLQIRHCSRTIRDLSTVVN